VFEYDYENQLTNVFVVGEWRNAYQYDAFGRRRVKREYTWSGSAWTLGSEVRYVYDGMLVLQERNGSNEPQVTYTRGTDLSGTLQGAGGIGGLLARTHNPSMVHPYLAATAHAYYHADGNGNITALLNTNGVVVARYSYDPYGNLLGMSGPLAEANTYRFSSKDWDAKPGLYYYGYRYYEPNLQRWVNTDPLGDLGSLVYITSFGASQFESIGAPNDAALFDAWAEVNRNLYAALGNRSPNAIDPDGRIPLIAAIIGVGGLVSGVIEAAATVRCGGSLGDVAKSFGVGFVSGAAGTAVGLAVAVGTKNPALIGASAGFTAHIVSESLKGNTLDPLRASTATGLGALGGAAAAKVPGLKQMGKKPDLFNPRPLKDFKKNSLRQLGDEAASGAIAGTLEQAVSGCD
jgi:RHS repeat-associated protein